jgi:hypothetical protein
MHYYVFKSGPLMLSVRTAFLASAGHTREGIAVPVKDTW